MASWVSRGFMVYSQPKEAQKETAGPCRPGITQGLFSNTSNAFWDPTVNPQYAVIDVVMGFVSGSSVAFAVRGLEWI